MSTEYSSRKDKLAGWPIRIQSYCVGKTWYAAVDNVDPGATVARAEGSSREEAETSAIAKARERLERTRRHD